MTLLLEMFTYPFIVRAFAAAHAFLLGLRTGRGLPRE